jgi:DNA adenine methylase
MINHPNDIQIVHGPNYGSFDAAGASVASVHQSLADAFNIPLGAVAFVNGKIVSSGYCFMAGDTAEFAFPGGVKGADGFKGPFPYHGGKAKVAAEIWRRFGDVKNYVEPFFGGGGVLLCRPKWGGSRYETVNDIDPWITNFWRSVRLRPDDLAKAADYPMTEFDLQARHNWLVRNRDDISKRILSDPKWCDPIAAGWWVWGICHWLSAGWCAPGTQHRRKPSAHGRGIHRICNRLENEPRATTLLRYFECLASRLEYVHVFNGDWSRVVTPAYTTNLGITGVFLDPPYVGESGRAKQIYAHDDLVVGHEVAKWARQNGDNPETPHRTMRTQG